MATGRPTTKQSWYIAWEKRGRRTTIHGSGKTPQGARVSATRHGAVGTELETTPATRALHEAFREKGGGVRFSISPKGRADLA